MLFADEHIVGAVNMPSISPDCRIVRVSGDSMSPVIKNGDLIAVRELSNFSQIFWGQIYVVVLDDFRMVKYVRRHENPDKVILRSENPKYDDMEVNRSEIRDLLVVQNVLHIDNRL
jgi:phage repressor protein C with HTH and peptisase S24 domain